MLESLVNKLACPSCLHPQAKLSVHAFEKGTEGHIRHGVVRCEHCGTAYPIEDDLLEMVTPALLAPADYNRFGQRFRGQLKALGINDQLAAQQPEADLSAQLKQREHFDWYAENEDQTYLDYAKSPFWTAADELTFARWKTMIQHDTWILDVGSANGRASWPWLAQPGLKLVGFDISKKLIRQAIEESRKQGYHGKTTFLVGDGHCLPFVDQSFDYAMTYGVLHHLPDPGASLRKIQDILKPGGIFFGSENNETVFRSIFDLMMKLSPLWTEEAGTEPLISRKMLHDWTAEKPVQLQYRTQVFLPPHLYNLLGNRLARLAMQLSDGMADWVPGIRHQGGLIVFEILKHRDETASWSGRQSDSHTKARAA